MRSLVKATVIAFIALCSAAPASADDPRQAMVNTPMSRVELLQALRAGHVAVFGEEPSRNRLAMAWAQVAFENGQGKWSWNHNVGNVVKRGSQPYFFSSIDHQRYRAFESFEDGAAAYWGTIRHCAPAVRMFDVGAPTAAARSLKGCGYFEAELAPYARAMASLYSTARNAVFKEEDDERQQQQELYDATHDEYAQLIEYAATRAASLGTCDDRQLPR